MIKLKLTRRELCALNVILQGCPITARGPREVIICGLADEIIEKLRRKERTDATRFTLSLKDYEGIAFDTYLQMILKQEQNDVSKWSIIYRVIRELQPKLKAVG